jgi:hypothetical protein
LNTLRALCASCTSITCIAFRSLNTCSTTKR